MIRFLQHDSNIQNITPECYLKAVQISSIKDINLFGKFKDLIIYQGLILSLLKSMFTFECS